MHNVIQGSTINLKLNIFELDGVNLCDDGVTFKCILYTKKTHKVTVCKNDMIKLDDENYMFVLDTTSLTPGKLFSELHVLYPSASSSAGYSKVILRRDTLITIIL